MPVIFRHRRISNVVNRTVHKRVFGSMNNITVIQYQDRGSTLGKTIANTLDMPDTNSLVSNDNINPGAGP
jgi:hypothetical protein